MGSYAYDYLNDSLLLDSSLITKIYNGVTDTELENELQKYREYCLGVLADVKSNIKASKRSVRCMATSTMSNISQLKKAALYLEEAVVADPIFKLTDFRSDISDTFQLFMGMEARPKVNRRELALAALRLIELRPLVAGGYVKLYPVTFELENKTDFIPLRHSNNGFEDLLPEPILNKYKASAHVRTVLNSEGQLLISNSLDLCRHIDVRFKGMLNGFGMGYTLPRIVSSNDELREVTLVLEKDSPPPTKSEFDYWIRQSINQTAQNHFIDLKKRIALCDHLDCMFGTEHSFESDLLNLNVGSTSIKPNTLNCTLQMEVPFLEHVSSDDLMSIRNNYGESFHSFRSELEKGLREARHESDPDRIKAIIEDTQHELFEVQMNQIAPQINHIRNTHLTEALIAFSGVGFSVLTGGGSLLLSVGALLHGFKSHSDYQSKVAANPCHFLWKVKQKAAS